MERRDQVFVSYCHTDNAHLKRLQVHLKPFEKEYSIKYWADTKIKPGEQWLKEIRGASERTAVAILLISGDFLASDFIMNNELPPFLEAEQSEGVKILPVIVDHCNFTSLPNLSKFQAVNDPAKPLSSITKSQREKVWAKVAETTKGALDDFKSKALATKAAEESPPSRQKMVKWNKVATLFWLGNDLMWIQDMTYRVAAPERVLEGVDGAIHYAKELGFDKHSHPIEQLTLAQQHLRQLVGISTEEQSSFLQGHYRGVRQYIEQVKWYIDRLAMLREPDFEKWRSFPK